MIYGFLHQGSGVGNQLHRMVATRVRALDLGVDWRMIWNPDESGKEEGFKASSFIDFDKSRIQYGFPAGAKTWNEKKVVENGVDIRGYDPEFNFVEDNTIIEGEFQDERYWAHREKEVNEWLKVEPLEVPDDVCVIGFRGGEYAAFPELFLTPDYWREAMAEMMTEHGVRKFEVHTDDPALATQFFNIHKVGKDTPIKVIHDTGVNWRSMRLAKYAIIANSSFFILPRWLKHGIGQGFETQSGVAVTIAPRYWARRNTGAWALPQNYYSRFLYI